ncbi:site-specific DNA-methyltransferase [Modicisalibacter zincidurans]|uniref:site-specific DNA-methyltransferase (adenine-specific) n=1 Tax=Modicisalibacter zincidurans TaxID=1178777 RepID=A0ABP9RBE0_9GAMM|nr:site-specific DNA-methyltransferase [Halomonas zincidurans]
MMDKLKMHSPNLTEANIAKLAELFPSCVTEARDEQGRVKQAIDFDQLRQELSDHIVEGPQERYHLNWPGKREALLAANSPIAKTLRPSREESVDFDTTKNLFIEGDNLEALKLLQETYLGKVKMIYIDPPYNTGNDFIYDDDFSEGAAEYLSRSSQNDDFGCRLTANTETNGRFHSDWLTMMHSRIRLARNLLRPDGVIFISIDDCESSSLRHICDEVFGENNLVANIVWQHSVQPKGYTQLFSVHHNHILCYSRSDEYVVQPLERTEKDNKNYSNPDDDPRGPWRAGDVRNALYRPNLIFPIVTPSEKTIDPPENGWRWKKATIKKKIQDGEIVFSTDESRIIRKIYLEDQSGRAPETIWFSEDVGNTRSAASELKGLFNGVAPFDTAKPLKLIDRMFQVAGLQPDDLCLDFFAGSCSTAHARLASMSPGPFIMIQMPEPIDNTKPHGKAAQNLGMATIADIGKERIRRAGNEIQNETGLHGSPLDVGFRVLKVDSSNLEDVYYRPDVLSQDLLSENVDNIREGRSSEDLLFQILLDWGVDLSLPISRQDIDGKTVFFVDGAEKHMALAACFDLDIDEAFVKQLAEYEPLRVVFRDAGFTSDSVKINVEQIFAQKSPNTEVKVL